MAFAGRQLGNLTIARALEIITPFDRATFFPETTPADWAPHESWLKPKAMDASGALLFPVQSYLVRTSHHTVLIDSCVGNHKQRPNRPAWHMKSDDTYMQALGALGVAPEDIDFVMFSNGGRLEASVGLIGAAWFCRVHGSLRDRAHARLNKASDAWAAQCALRADRARSVERARNRRSELALASSRQGPRPPIGEPL